MHKLRNADKHFDMIDDVKYVLVIGSFAILEYGVDGNNIAQILLLL